MQTAKQMGFSSYSGPHYTFISGYRQKVDCHDQQGDRGAGAQEQGFEAPLPGQELQCSRRDSHGTAHLSRALLEHQGIGEVHVEVWRQDYRCRHGLRNLLK